MLYAMIRMRGRYLGDASRSSEVVGRVMEQVCGRDRGEGRRGEEGGREPERYGRLSLRSLGGHEDPASSESAWERRSWLTRQKPASRYS